MNVPTTFFECAKLTENAFSKDPIWQFLNTKKTSHASLNYWSHKIVISLLFNDILGIQRDVSITGSTDSIKANIMGVCISLLNARIPTYYVDEHLIRAASMTDIPSGMKYKDLLWPFPAAILHLPLNFSKEYFGREIGAFFVNHTKAGNYSHPYFRHSSWSVTDKSTLVIHEIVPKMEFFQQNLVSSFADDHLIDVDIAKYDYQDYCLESDSKTRASDKATLEKAVSLLARLLLFLKLMPSLIQTPKLEREAHIHHNRVKPALYHPTWIGKGYYLKNESGEIQTRLSPRFHLRRGHIVLQAINTSSTEFIHRNQLPHKETGEIDWVNISEDIRNQFWNCHEQQIRHPVLVNKPRINQ